MLVATLLPIPALLGVVIGNVALRLRRASSAVAVLLVGWLVIDTVTFAPTPSHVTSVIEIDAPPASVWSHVVAFPEIERQTQPLSCLLGYPQPRRAYLEGEGATAIRHCVFDQGEFLEPIEVWLPGKELTFACTGQPTRLQGYLDVTRGQFLLEALPGNRTRITGTTWYDLHCQPAWYFDAICQWLIGDIHDDVLRNIRRLSERD